MNQPKFATQKQAYEWISQNLQIGQTVELELDQCSYQKVMYLSRHQRQNLEFHSKKFGTMVCCLTLKSELSPPKRDNNNKKRVKKERVETPYFDVDSFYELHRSHTHNKNDSTPVCSTVKLPRRS